MGIGEWFKKTFGKQACAFCGKDRGHFIRSSYYPFSVEG